MKLERQPECRGELAFQEDACDVSGQDPLGDLSLIDAAEDDGDAGEYSPTLVQKKIEGRSHHRHDHVDPLRGVLRAQVVRELREVGGGCEAREVEGFAIDLDVIRRVRGHIPCEACVERRDARQFCTLVVQQHDALRFAAVILGDGESARLPAKLVREDAVATEARAELDIEQGRAPGLFRLDVRLAESASVLEVEKKVDAAFDELAARPPSATEMTRAKRRIETEFVMGLAWNRNRAIEIGKYELFYGDARQIGRELERIDAVTAEDVQKAAGKYLVKARRALVETRPKPTAPAGSGTAPAEVSR